jgi:hypothetical protein
MTSLAEALKKELIKSLLFDLDDTLYDSMDSFQSS